MKVAILGSKGRLGKILVETFVKLGHVTYEFTRDNFDLDRFILKGYAELPKVEIIINTIAFTNVDECELDKKKRSK